MAFFSLLDPVGEGAPDYVVERCHINVWSLPGWFGHRPMLLDVGILFETTSRLETMEMALPIGASPGVRDLADVVKKSDVALLLFGHTFDSATGDKLLLRLEKGEPATTTIPVIAIDADASKVDRVDDDLSTATLKLAPASPTGLCYLRVRFIVDNPGTMWRWQRVLGRRNGLLVDFRVPDPREERHEKAKGLEGRAKEIKELDAFFMVPERFLLVAENPALKYTRTLEDGAWDDYLRRSLHGISAHRRGHQRLMVHRWHPETAGEPKKFGRDAPFRGFLQFTRQPAFRAPSDLLLTMLAVAACLFLLFRPLSLRSGPRDLAEDIGELVDNVVALGVAQIAALSLIAVGGVIWQILKRTRKLPTFFHQVKRKFKTMEYRWFKTLH